MATLTLFDGTQLTAERLADSGGRAGLTEQVSVSTCERCFHQEQRGQVEVTQVTSERAPSSALRFDDLSLQATGPSARRVRWEIFSLP